VSAVALIGAKRAAVIAADNYCASKSLHLVVPRLTTCTVVGAEVEALKVLSVGVSVAVSTCLPVTAGLHEQVAVLLG